MSDPGHAVHPDVFSAPEMAALCDALRNPGIARTRAGARHLLGLEGVARLANDARLLAIAGGWLGGRARPVRATLFDKSADANWLVGWHQDTALPLRGRSVAGGWGPWSQKAGVDYAHAPASALRQVIALRVHLDDCGADNGPLRVLPGTHQLGVMSDAQLRLCAARISPVPCCAGAGGVIAMRPLLVHASSKAVSPAPRRVLHLEYAATLEIEAGVFLRVA
jgi:hypothetical protein